MPYFDQVSPTQRRLIAVLVLAAISLVLVQIYLYAASHGKLNMADIKQFQNVSVQVISPTANQNQPQTLTNRSTTLSSGRYTLEATKDGGLYTQTVQVPTFLHTVQVAFASTVSKAVQRVASNTRVAILPSETGYISFDDQSLTSFLSHAPQDAFGQQNQTFISAGSAFASWKRTSEGLISVALTPDGSQAKPVLLDFTKKTSVLSEASTSFSPTDQPAVVTDPSGRSAAFAIFTGVTMQTLTYYPDFTQNGTRLSTPAPARNGGEPIATTAGNELALLTGSDDTTPSSGDNVDQPVVIKDAAVHLYNLTQNKETQVLQLGKTNQISALSLSPDNTLLALVNHSQLQIWDLRTRQVIFDGVSSGIGNLIWRDNTKLDYSVLDKGISEFDAARVQSYPLFNTQAININTMELVGSQIYFSGFPKAKVSSELPDGYMLDLTKDTPDDNQLLTKLPVYNPSYKIDTIGNTIYAETYPASSRRADGAMTFDDTAPTVPYDSANASGELMAVAAQAKEYLAKNITGLERYSIVTLKPAQ